MHVTGLQHVMRSPACLIAGEAQKIDRIMEKFAERYCRDNPGAFRTPDGAYLLSFALIMLNTDAHNPMADKKLAVEDFVGMCQSTVSAACTLACPTTIALLLLRFLLLTALLLLAEGCILLSAV